MVRRFCVLVLQQAKKMAPKKYRRSTVLLYSMDTIQVKTRVKLVPHGTYGEFSTHLLHMYHTFVFPPTLQQKAQPQKFRQQNLDDWNLPHPPKI
jgi:hypothetical protein